jgi:hypothetical protein
MDILKKRKAVIVSIITFLEVLVSVYNCINSYSEEKGIVLAIIIGVLFAACECFQFYSIVEIAERPVIGVIMLAISQVFTFVYEVVTGATANEALNDMGVIGFIVIIAMLIHMIITNKIVNDKKNNNNDKIGKRFKNIIFYKRNLLKIKWYTRVIIYSLMITTVMSLANSEIVTTLNDSTTFRLYAALVLAVPTFLVFGILTTSYMAYEMMIFKIMLEIYTIYLLSTVNSMDYIQIVYIVIELIVITYSYAVVFRNEQLEKENNKEAKKVSHKKSK